MFKKIYPNKFTSFGAILSDDMSNNKMPINAILDDTMTNDAMQNDSVQNNAMSSYTLSNDTITASEYECLKTLLIKHANNKYVTKIECIIIKYTVDY